MPLPALLGCLFAAFYWGAHEARDLAVAGLSSLAALILPLPSLPKPPSSPWALRCEGFVGTEAAKTRGSGNGGWCWCAALASGSCLCSGGLWVLPPCSFHAGLPLLHPRLLHFFCLFLNHT